MANTPGEKMATLDKAVPPSSNDRREELREETVTTPVDVMANEDNQ